MITLKKLADKARNEDWNLTNEEAIQIFLLIPEGCVRDEVRYGNHLRGRLVVKGLGDFIIR